MPVQEALIEVALPQRQPLRPLETFRGSLAQRVYASLRHAILSLNLRPGDILRKPEICAALGVSRSPVSEAVARLAGEHLVRRSKRSRPKSARISWSSYAAICACRPLWSRIMTSPASTRPMPRCTN